jgi:hypothetical protein
MNEDDAIPETLEASPPDGSLMSDMARKMAQDIREAIGRYIPIARTMGIADPDIRDTVMSALAFNVPCKRTCSNA